MKPAPFLLGLEELWEGPGVHGVVLGDGDYNSGGLRFRDVDQAMATDSQCDAIGNAVKAAAERLLFTGPALFYIGPSVQARHRPLTMCLSITRKVLVQYIQ
jgi:hypothetical protein